MPRLKTSHAKRVKEGGGTIGPRADLVPRLVEDWHRAPTIAVSASRVHVQLGGRRPLVLEREPVKDGVLDVYLTLGGGSEVIGS